MPVKIIPDEYPTPPCAHCGDVLRVDTTTVRVYVFDDMHEVADEIRNGSINRAICPRCGYRGWLWPGFLVMDRRRSIGVFVDLELDDESANARQHETLEVAEELLGSEVYETILSRIVRVYDYRDVYQLLCADDRMFEVQVASSLAFRARVAIADVESRAHQWLDDTLKIGAFVLWPEENDPDFLSALSKVIDRNIANNDLAEEVREGLCQVRTAIASIDLTPEPRHVDVQAKGLEISRASELNEDEIRVAVDMCKGPQS
jgi:hypothetical protein